MDSLTQDSSLCALLARHMTEEHEFVDGARVLRLSPQLGELHARSVAGHWSAFVLPQFNLAFDWCALAASAVGSGGQLTLHTARHCSAVLSFAR